MHENSSVFPSRHLYIYYLSYLQLNYLPKLPTQLLTVHLFFLNRINTNILRYRFFCFARTTCRSVWNTLRIPAGRREVGTRG